MTLFALCFAFLTSARAKTIQTEDPELKAASGIPSPFINSAQNMGVPSYISVAVALGDLDGDGDLDAWVANGSWGDQPNRVWLNDGKGQFTDSG